MNHTQCDTVGAIESHIKTKFVIYIHPVSNDVQKTYPEGVVHRVDLALVNKNYEETCHNIFKVLKLCLSEVCELI